MARCMTNWKSYVLFLSATGFLGHILSMPMPTMAAGASKSHQAEAGEFMTDWLVLGAIPITDGEADSVGEEAQKAAFTKDFLSEHGGESKIQPHDGLAHQIGEQTYSWQQVQSEEDSVDLLAVYGELEYVVAYAWAEIPAPEAQSVLLGIGSDDGVKVWLNGELVHEKWEGRGVTPDQDLVPVTLRSGTNSLLLKVQNMQMGWGFACRELTAGLLTDRLMEAADRGNLDDLKLLLTHGADVNAQKHGLTALHMAQMAGRQQAIKYLLDQGADTSVKMPDMRTVIEESLKESTKDESPGVAVLVAKDGEIVYQTGSGYASLAHHVPVTLDTKFRIGSVTKQFTASAILKLQEEGKLSVEDKLSKFFPDFPRGDEVTIHHLLTHISGIHSYTNKPDFMEHATSYIEPDTLVEQIMEDEYDFDPGEKWEYNNSGYFLLGVIVAKTSGMSFDDYLKRTFFEPLGMHDTGIHERQLILEHEATGYSFEGGKLRKAVNWDMSRAGGAGALYSTVEDLYRWNEAVFGGKVLSQESLDAAFTPVKLNSGEIANAMGGTYGYGWMMSELRGLKVISHGGGLHGFSSYLARNPDHNTTIAVLVNSLPPAPGLLPSEIASRLSQFILWNKMDSQVSLSVDEDIDVSVYDAYVGRYAYPQSMVCTFTREEGRLFAQLTGQPKLEIFPNTETEFFWKVVDAQVTFVKDADGNVTHVIHRQNGKEFEAPRLEEEEAGEVDPAIYAAYVGEYDMPNVGTLTVSQDGEHIYVQLTGQPRFEIFPRSETEFFLKVVQADLTFVEEDGKVTKVILKQGGMTLEGSRTDSD